MSIRMVEAPLGEEEEMSFARICAAAALVLVAATAHAGMLHPALEARLDQALPDEPISVIVHMKEQAPVATLNDQLRYQKATRNERHRVVVEALQSATTSQDALKADLTASMGRGGVLGYTGYWISNLLVVYALPSEIRRIADRSDVDVVELNFEPELIEPVGRPADNQGMKEDEPTRGIGVTPGLRAIRAPEVWYELGYTGVGRLIGSCDTGVFGSHVALATRWRGYQGAEPWQECWLDVLGTGTQFPNDGNGHGTHTTGTMTGLGAATEDTVGVAWGAKWIACNAIAQNAGSGFDNDIITSFQWFADPDGNPNTTDDVPDVVQNSWGINEGFSSNPPYTDCDSRWWAVIDNAEAAGVVTTWSAGNEGPGSGSLRSPADRATTTTNCFSVGAVSAQAGEQFPYAIANFSSRGPSGCNVPPEQKLKPEVAAPGVEVYSTLRSGGYGSTGWSGTSMAGPHVAGIVALLREADPNLEVDTIKQIIMDTSRDEGATGEDNTYGWGFVDAHAALILATVGFGRIEGHVYNASWNNVPIPLAHVEILETSNSWDTDGEGLYGGQVAAGEYNLRASRSGFTSQTVPVTLISNETTVQDFYLVDTAGPEITDVSQPVSTTDTVGPYLIEATVFDLSTVTSVRLYYRVNGGAWAQMPMTLGFDTYATSIPGQPVNTQIDYYVQATDGIGLISTDPPIAPADFYSLFITEVTYAYDAESADAGWVLGMTGDDADAGLWVRADPVGTQWNGEPVQPEDDHTPAPGVNCFVTGNGSPGGSAGEADVDHGCVSLRSPIFDLSTVEQAFVSYWRWFGQNGNAVDDEFAVDVSADGGATWVPLERVPGNQNSWQLVTVSLGDLVMLSDEVTVRFRACDDNSQGLVEAAIDDFSLMVYSPAAESVEEVGVRAVSALDQNRPNPFRGGANLTAIRFTLSNSSEARVEIFDAAGRLVRTLHEGPLASGPHSLYWNGRDDAGKPVGAGVYFYRLRAGAYEQSRSMTVLR